MNENKHPLVKATVSEDPAAGKLIDKLDLQAMAVLAEEREGVDTPQWFQAQIDHHLSGLSAAIATLHQVGLARWGTEQESLAICAQLLVALCDRPETEH